MRSHDYNSIIPIAATRNSTIQFSNDQNQMLFLPIRKVDRLNVFVVEKLFFCQRCDCSYVGCGLDCNRAGNFVRLRLFRSLSRFEIVARA